VILAKPGRPEAHSLQSIDPATVAVYISFGGDEGLRVERKESISATVVVPTNPCTAGKTVGSLVDLFN
jgi:hypothetical protein